MGILKQSGPEEIAYQGKLLEIVRTPMSDGEREVTFEKARRAPGVRLIIHDTKQNKILLTKEHRYELGADDFRLPGGKVVDSLDEFHELLSEGTIAEAAQQKAREEAREEAGVIVDAVTQFHHSIVGATVDWDLYYFVVDEFTLSHDGQRLEHGESIEVEWYDYAEAEQMSLDGRVSEERSALVLLRWLHMLDSSR